jgi:hypothetical protein
MGRGGHGPSGPSVSPPRDSAARLATATGPPGGLKLRRRRRQRSCACSSACGQRRASGGRSRPRPAGPRRRLCTALNRPPEGSGAGWAHGGLPCSTCASETEREREQLVPHPTSADRLGWCGEDTGGAGPRAPAAVFAERLAEMLSVAGWKPLQVPGNSGGVASGDPEPVYAFHSPLLLLACVWLSRQ